MRYKHKNDIKAYTLQKNISRHTKFFVWHYFYRIYINECTVMKLSAKFEYLNYFILLNLYYTDLNVPRILWDYDFIDYCKQAISFELPMWSVRVIKRLSFKFEIKYIWTGICRCVVWLGIQYCKKKDRRSEIWRETFDAQSSSTASLCNNRRIVG